jgi:hypothetical protein
MASNLLSLENIFKYFVEGKECILCLFDLNSSHNFLSRNTLHHYGWCSGSNIENSNFNKEGTLLNRQSAGVCKEESLTAPQRINAKDLWYILGLIEGKGSFSCFLEKRGSASLLRAEMSLALEEADIKLVYWVKKQFGYGSVKLNNSSKTALAVKNIKTTQIARYIIKSKVDLMELLN